MTRRAQVCRPSQGNHRYRPRPGTVGEVMHVWLLTRPKQPSLSLRQAQIYPKQKQVRPHTTYTTAVIVTNTGTSRVTGVVTTVGRPPAVAAMVRNPHDINAFGNGLSHVHVYIYACQR